MSKRYSDKVITAHLKKESIGILGTWDKNNDSIRQRVMYYGFDQKLSFYLMSTKGSPKIEQILADSHFSFIVFGIEDPFDESWEVEINGQARLLATNKEIDSALDRLKDGNPFAEVAFESGITSHFDFIQLTPKVIRFRIYGEALKGTPPTVLEM